MLSPLVTHLAKRVPAQGNKDYVTGIALRDRVKKWLQDSGLYSTMSTQPGLVFMVQGRYPKTIPPGGQPLNFFVIQQEDDNSAISVVSNVVFNEQHKMLFSSLDEARRRQVLSEVQSALWFQCGFSFQQDEKTKEYLGIQLSDVIYTDSIEPLSKNSLLKVVGNLYRSYMFISWKLQELTLQPPVER